MNYVYRRVFWALVRAMAPRRNSGGFWSGYYLVRLIASLFR